MSHVRGTIKKKKVVEPIGGGSVIKRASSSSFYYYYILFVNLIMINVKAYMKEDSNELKQFLIFWNPNNIN